MINADMFIHRVIQLLRIILAVIAVAVSFPAVASEAMSLKQVVEVVIANHPDLQINHVDIDIAETETQRIEGTLDPVVSAGVGLSEEQIPTFSDFQASETRAGYISGTISKPLASGDTLAAAFNYNRISQGFVSPFAAQLARFNPAYRNQIDVSYRHPFLKGSDRPDYLQSLIAAQAGITQAERQQQVIEHVLSLQALNAYYQLVFDGINIHIAEEAVGRASKLISYQRTREKFGLNEKSDRLQAEALLATRRTNLQRAMASRLNDQSALNRLMLRPSDASIVLERSNEQSTNLPTPEHAFKQAEIFRPELQVLKAQMEAAEAELAIASDSDQMQLDMVAELGTRSLDSNAATAAARGFSSNDHFVGLSFELSDVLGRNSVNAAIRKAELQRQRIEAQRISTIEQIRDDISAAMTTIIAGQPTLEEARKQVVAERRKFNEEIKRYRGGRSDTATLVQFEGELRNAQLNAELQQLTLQLAWKQLSWAQGRLLYDIGLMNEAGFREKEKRNP